MSSKNSKKIQPHEEKTLFIVKPDGVQRGLVGEIISRFEKKGLKIIGLKFIKATRKKAEEHYSAFDDQWREMVGETLKKSYQNRGAKFPYKSLIEAGETIRNATIDYLASGPITIMVLQGSNAVSTVRKLLGSTDPSSADIGTIRGDFTIDSYGLANTYDRSIRNLAHASGSVEEAEREIKLWFKTSELVNYNLAIDEILYDPEWVNIREDIISDKK